MSWQPAISQAVKKPSVKLQGDDVIDWTDIVFIEKMQPVERLPIFYYHLQGNEYPAKLNKLVLVKLGVKT
jgi:hypothetical protein